MNRRSNSPRRTLELKADKLWQETVMLKWKGRCAFNDNHTASCGHHIIGRANKSTRHKLMNGIALSHKRHVWADEHHAEFVEWLEKDYPLLAAWHESNRNLPPRPRHLDDIRMDIAMLHQAIRDMV